MQRRQLSKALFAAAAGSAITAKVAEAQTCTTPCYPQTSAESAAGVTPNTTYPSGPIVDIRRYGWSSSNTGAQNATALNTAFSLAVATTSSGNYGVTILLPPGTYAVNAFTIPQYVIVRGSGKRATILTYTSTGPGAMITLGGTGSSLYYGTGITDLSVQFTGTEGICVLAQGTVGAEIARLYLEGENIVAGRTTLAVEIDGSNASSFFNKIDQVEANHWHAGFVVTTLGSEPATQQIFVDCNVTGDVATDATSSGFFVNSGCGDNTVLTGCDFEYCGFGIYLDAGNITFFGCRTEGNGADIYASPSINPCTFVGCTLNSFPGSASTGYYKHQYLGCFSYNGSLQRNVLAPTTCYANSAADIPLLVQGYSGQTSDVVQVQDSTGAENFGISPAGELTVNNQVTTGSTTAAFSASNKPGSTNGGPTKWLTIKADGELYTIPLWPL